MDSSENTMNFETAPESENVAQTEAVSEPENAPEAEAAPEPENAPKAKGSKKKGIVIGAIIAAVAVIVAAIIVAIALDKRYLDKVKDFYPVDDFSFNGYEIVNDDGLFYLTKDGKKVSRTGYTMLTNLSVDGYKELMKEEDGINVFAAANDAKIYDCFLARKEDSDNYFIVLGEGEEYMLEGEDWEYEETILPFVMFRDSVTGEYGVLSLESLDSDISKQSDEELSLKVFDNYETGSLAKKNILADLVVLENNDAGADSPCYFFVNAKGSVMFKSVYDYEIAAIPLEDGDYRLFISTSEGVLYNTSGEKLQDNVIDWDNIGDSLVVTRDPEKNNPEAVNTSELVVYSENTSFTITGAEYNIYGYGNSGNLIWTTAKNSLDYTLFNLSTGEKTVYKDITGVAGSNNIIRCTVTNGFNYVDTETGKTVLTSQYGDMIPYMEYSNVLYSTSEPKVNNATYVLYFVAPGKSAVSKHVYNNQSVQRIYSDTEGNSTYIVTTTDTESGVVRKSVYAPFTTNPETMTYDEISVVMGVFAEGAPIAIGSSYDSNRFDFIDVADSKIVHSVTPGEEKMPLTSIYYDDTYVLFAGYEEGVEFAVFKAVEKDSNNDTAKESYYAFSRATVMTEGDEPTSVAPLKMTELGDKVDFISASSYSEERVEDSIVREWDASKYMVVTKSAVSTDIYQINSAYGLEKIATIPYGDVDVVKYGDELDQVYLSVANFYNDSERALYTVKGDMIIGFHGDIEVSYDGEYILATRNGVYGAYKYDAEKGRVKQVLDFDYSYIGYVGDGGFIVEDTMGGDIYLYDGKNPAKPDPITNMRTVTVVSWDEEAEKFVKSENVYYYIAGKLYVHRGEGVALVDTTAVGSVATAQYGICHSYTPTLVNFYDENGKFIGKKTIKPTVKDIAEFKMLDEGNWYSVSTEAIQNAETKVTAENIKAVIKGGGGVINVYKGHAQD